MKEQKKHTKKKKEQKTNILQTKVYLVLLRNLVLDKIPKLKKKPLKNTHQQNLNTS